MHLSIISAIKGILRFIYIYIYIYIYLHRLITKRICLHKLHKTFLIIKKAYWIIKLGKNEDMISWEWEFLEVSAIQNEDIISWEWEFLEVSSICGGGGRKFVCG